MTESKVRVVQKAILKGDLKAIDDLLANEIDVSYRTEVEDWNLLHLALQSLVTKPKLEVVQHLIDRNVDVNAKDGIGCTPLHYAVRARHLESARVLLESGSEVNVTNLDGYSPLRWADHGRSKNLEMIELLLQHGADPDLSTDRLISTREYATAISSPFNQQTLELLERYSRK